MIPGSANPLLLATAAGAAGGYAIERSLRFNSSDSAYLSRVLSTAGNQQTWTWSAWVKLSNINKAGTLFSGASGQLYYTQIKYFGLDTGVPARSHKIHFQNYDTSSLSVEFYDVYTQALFRDPSAWYHLVFAIDTTQATPADRVKIYINGALADVGGSSGGSATYGNQNTNTHINRTTDPLRIGDHPQYSSNNFDGYLADIHFIDGQALDPTSFGEFDDNGIWQPIAFTGSYGTNGFHLPFSDNSTAASLGDDTSGNNNDWTVNNISVTAGAGNDSLVDSPTNGTQTDTGVGGEVVGNYCTLSPLDNGSNVTLSNGNLDVAGNTSSNTGNVSSTIRPTTGKWYFEVIVNGSTSSGSNGYPVIGIVPFTQATTNGTVGYPGAVTNSVGYESDGSLRTSGTDSAGWGSSFTSGDVIGVAYDIDNGAIYFAKNNVWQNSGVPTSGASKTGAAFTWTAGANEYKPAFSCYDTTTSISLNFGQRPFAYTAPSGYKALCTTNLPAPTIEDPSTVMDVVLYTGDGQTTQTVALPFEPGLTWHKVRSGSGSHYLHDAIRGFSNSTGLRSNGTNAEGVNSIYYSLSQSGSNLTFGDVSPGNEWNVNGSTHVIWTWDAGSSTVTNTDGSITSTVSVRANASAGFSVVTYTGTGVNCTVGHGLNVAPSLIIVKSRSVANDWAVYHAANTSDPKTDYLLLNSTAATADDNTYWNDTAPTSTVFSIGTNADVNTNGTTYVAYCWAPLVGYSSGFSYTGNGSADGSFVYLGFRPRLILLKCSSTTGNWTLLDTAREGYNVDNDPLYPNLSNAEGTTDLLDITSNGFKLRTTDASVNSSGATYVGYAWAEAPFAYSRAR